MTYKRKKYHFGDTHLKRRWRVRSRKRDLDQIDKDLKPENAEPLLHQEVDVDKPGDAQFYCLHCARYFIDDKALNEHFRTKVHKRRLKALELEPWSIEDSERAAGKGNFVQPKRRKMTTQTPHDESIAMDDDEATSDSSKARPIFTPTPDLKSKFENVEELQKNINARGLSANAVELKELWEFYTSLNDTRNQLEKRRVVIAEQMSDFTKIGGQEAKAEAEKLRIEGRLLRQDLKDLMQAFWEVEEKTMTNCLALPNDLHGKTPRDGELVVTDKISPNRSLEKLDHLEVGKHLIDYRGPSWYYLKNSAAVFDLALINYFQNGFKKLNFRPIISPDFSCAALVEGCGTSPDSSLRLQPVDENMHLVGGASLPAFCAFYAKNSVPFNAMPIRHVTAGKKYLPGNGSGLFGAWQRSSVDFFIATPDAVSLDNELEIFLKNLEKFYDDLGWEYRLVFLPPSKLSFWESFRASFQMFSSSLNQFVQVGSVSLSGSFLSRRMSMEFKEKDSKDFCHIISGNAVDGTSVLACLLENNVNNLFQPVLIPYSFGTVR